AKVEEEREELGSSLWSLSSFSFWQQRAYRGLVRVLLAQGRSEEAFVQLETARARYLADVLTARRSAAELSPHARTRYTSLTEELAEVRTALASTGSTPEVPMLTAREAALQSAMARMVAFTPRPPHLSLAAMQKALGGSRVLLSYFIDARDREHHRRATSHVFVLTSDTLLAVPLIGVDDVSLDSLLDASGYGLAESGGVIEQASRPLDGLFQLYQKLVAPVAALLPAGAPLIVVPDGTTAAVPFAALVEKPTPSFAYADAPYLVRRFPISYSFGAQFISASASHPEPCGHVLAIGRSAFGKSDAPSLPFVRTEITRLAHRFRGVRTLLDGDATESALYASLGQADIVHIASHVAIDPLRPLRSRILLNAGGSEDGTVYMHEMLGEGMKSALVVLSACNTARGTAASGEGVLGFHYAFQAAGARSTVATLWETADRPSAKIMSTFYAALADGLPKDEALRKAQLTYLSVASRDAASPYFWAAPVLYGSTQPVALKEKDLPFTGRRWMVISSMLLGSLLLWVAHRKREKV
ncbi:MAG TPA: CHAT domain-containing protein, partial [Rhodothermales bacterium]|nr:CHAT domain-containing protein [Rhodothermales bacterium]